MHIKGVLRMKKIATLALSLLMVMALVLGITACNEEETVTLINKNVKGLTFDDPSDFGDFAEKDGSMLSTNKDSTASIQASEVMDTEGFTINDWTVEDYKEALASYSNVQILEFKTDVTVSSNPTLYARYTAKNSNGAEIEAYNYIIFYLFDNGNDKYQGVTFVFSKNDASSLKSNIDAVRNSLKVVNPLG